jgi:hypothetical protein
VKRYGVALLALVGMCSGQSPRDVPFSFKGNSLGMTLQAFKASNNQGQVWIAWGSANWRGKAKKENKKQVPTPLCTDDYPSHRRWLANLVTG